MPELANVIRLVAWPLVCFVVLSSLALAVVVRRRYVAAVVRLQGRGDTVDSWPDAAPGSVPPLALTFEELAGARPSASNEIWRLRRRALIVQFACDLLFWCAFLFLVMSGAALGAALIHAATTGDYGPLLFIVRFSATAPFSDTFVSLRDWTYLPFVALYVLGPPAVVIAGQAAFRKIYVYLPVACATGALLYGTAWNVDRSFGAEQYLAGAMAFAAVIGILAIAIAMLQHPRVRGAAAPLIVTLALGLAPWTAVLLAVVGTMVEAQQAANTPSSDLVDSVLLLVFTALVVATCGGIVLALARRYQRKRFSDIELGRVAFWLLSAFAVFGFSALIQNSGGLSVLALQLAAIVGCWLLAGVVRRALWRRLFRRAPSPAGALLVLRVFKRPAASEAFVDRLLSSWRFAAPVHMIAGPDLAGATIEPTEFFAFIRRRLGNLFLRDRSEIAARIDRLDNARDPDGRFRVNELFCAERAWRPAVEALMARAALVLLDLREYHPNRAGTRYEIYQLMNLVPPERVLILIGKDDDAGAIGSALQQAWMAMDEASPNRRLPRPELRVCRLRSESASEFKALFWRMHAMAAAPQRELPTRGAAT